MTGLKNIASLCEFSTLKCSLISDMVVCGIRSDEVRAKLLRDVIKGNICMSIY